MKKVREIRNFVICLDRMRKWELEILGDYVNGDFSELKKDIECRFDLSETTTQEKTQIDEDINVLDIVFKCISYYNKLDELCEVDIIEFL